MMEVWNVLDRQCGSADNEHAELETLKASLMSDVLTGRVLAPERLHTQLRPTGAGAV